MKLRKKGIIAMMALIGFGFSAVVTSTLAWFKGEITLQGLTGGMKGAYFAGGDGSADNPYQITHPIHLYNLAWLQYLGTFNNDKATNPETGSVLTDSSGHQMTYRYHFVIKNDLDMSGWALPPIGTEQYPFIGHLDGGNFVVSNLITSNDVLSEEVNVEVAESVFSSALAKRPQVVTAWNSSDNHPQPNIVGMFGVIGNLEDKNGNVSGTTYYYDSEANCVENLGIAGLTVKTRTSSALIGMAAGYVNGKVSNVAVDSSSINVASSTSALTSFTNNLSDYSIIGYCTDDYKKDITKVDQTIYGVNVSQNNEFSANDSGNTQGWGGSVNMLDMYNRLTKINASSAQTNFAYRDVETYDADGNKINTDSASYNGFYFYTTKPKIGNFNIIRNTGNFRYLAGGKRVIKKYYSYYEHTGRYITDGTHYLTFDGSTLSSTTDSKRALLWETPVKGGSGFISTKYENSTYYLRNNNGTLTATASTYNRTTWQINADGSDIYSGNYHLLYSGSWRLYYSSQTYYYISNGSNYLTLDTSKINSANGIVNSTNRDEATLWYRENNYIYTLVNGTKYYLCFVYYPGSGEYLYLGLGVYTTTTYAYQITGSTYLYSNNDQYPYYLTFNSSSLAWSQSSGTNYSSGASIELTNNNLVFGDTITVPGPDSYLDDTKQTSSMVYSATDTTYFPLNVAEDGTQNDFDKYLPTDSNTGYVISGANIDDSTTVSDGGPSLIRVSKYDISDIENSYKNSDGGIVDSKVYTHDASGNKVTIAADTFEYQKYGDSKSTLYEKVLKGASNVYGLHFMSSQISASATVPARNISILGTEYSTYELPVNSIDFNLKQKGYINFFSGTYFSSTVTSFFSLHQIFRSGTSITQIKEIAEIYGNENKKNYGYAYKYTDGTFSTPFRFDGSGTKYMLTNGGSGTTAYQPGFLTSTQFEDYEDDYGYVPIFNTDRITNIRNGSVIKTLTQNALYYFEIPMNDGEYCLGSVNGGTGGYLIYLDIGANAAKTQRTIVSEHYTRTDKTFEYPIGVAFISRPETAIDETNSICASIPVTFYGKSLSISRSEDSITLKEGNSETLTGDLVYLGDSIKIENNILAKLKPKSTIVKEVKRLQYYDWNVNMEELTRTIITDTTTTENSGTPSTVRAIEQYDKSGNLVAQANWKIYRTRDGVKYSGSDLTSLISGSLALNGATASGGLGWTDPGNTILLAVHYLMNEDTTSSETLTLTMAVDTTNTAGQYYVFHDYAFVVTRTGDNITIEVIAKGTGTITINGTAVTSVGQTIEVPTS